MAAQPCPSCPHAAVTPQNAHTDIPNTPHTPSPCAFLTHTHVHTNAHTFLSSQVLGGNTALALLLTIATNLASVFTLPFLLPWALKVGVARGA